jgi:hypothetical protein
MPLWIRPSWLSMGPVLDVEFLDYGISYFDFIMNFFTLVIFLLQRKIVQFCLEDHLSKATFIILK